MDDLISRNAAIDALIERDPNCGIDSAKVIEKLPSAQPEIVRCKDCKYQGKVFHEDKRRKDGGYYIFLCELVDGYSPVCFDDEFCSRAERRTDE